MIRSPRPPFRHGFSIIELLVVIAVIAILVALLLPAMQTARASARQIQCMNNMKNVAVAIENFSTQYNGNLPTLHHVREVNGTPTWFPWPVQILNQLGQPSIERQWSTNPQPDGYLEVLVCPSDQFNVGAIGGTSFVLNCGYGLYNTCLPCCIDIDRIHCHVDQLEILLPEFAESFGAVTLDSETSGPHGMHCLCTYNSVMAGLNGAGVERTIGLDWNRDGVITVEEDEITRSTGVFWNPNPANPRPATMHWIVNGDGTGSTLLVSERTGSNHWGRVSSMWNCPQRQPVIEPSTMYLRFLAVIRDKGFGLSTDAFCNASNEFVYPKTGDWTVQAERPLAFDVVASNRGAQCKGGPRPRPGKVINEDSAFNIGPKGEHMTGVNAVFCDGHGKTLSNDLDPTVYALLLSPNGHRYGQKLHSNKAF